MVAPRASGSGGTHDNHEEDRDSDATRALGGVIPLRSGPDALRRRLQCGLGVLRPRLGPRAAAVRSGSGRGCLRQRPGSGPLRRSERRSSRLRGRSSGAAPPALTADAPVIASILDGPPPEVVMRSRRSVARTRTLLLGSLAALLLVAPQLAGAVPPFEIRILSSAPDQVSDGDALVRVQFPDPDSPSKATLLLNGVNVTSSLSPVPGEAALEGVVSGFAVGENLLVLKSNPK